MSFPPVIGDSLGENLPPGVFIDADDSAKYLIERRRFERPTLHVPPKGPKFEWPGGVEGLSISGAPGLAEHRYLGDNAPVVQIVHRDASRFEMRGMFPGKTGSENVRDLRAVITAVAPLGYWILSTPAAIFTNEQFVVIENYSFDHAEDEQMGSWTYVISFIKTGIGVKNKKPKTTRSPVNPVGSIARPNKGKGRRVFTTKNGANTLRAVAKIVYGNPNRWREVYNKNTKLLKSLNVPLTTLQYKRLPYGMKLNY